MIGHELTDDLIEAVAGRGLDLHPATTITWQDMLDNDMDSCMSEYTNAQAILRGLLDLGWKLTPPGETPPAVTPKRRTFEEVVVLNHLRDDEFWDWWDVDNSESLRSLYAEGLIVVRSEQEVRITPAGRAVLEAADAEFDAAGGDV